MEATNTIKATKATMEINNVTQRKYALTQEEKGAWLDPANATPYAKAVRAQWEHEELTERMQLYARRGGNAFLNAVILWMEQCEDGSAASPFDDQTYGYEVQGDVTSPKYLELRAEVLLARKNADDASYRVISLRNDTGIDYRNPKTSDVELMVHDARVRVKIATANAQRMTRLKEMIAVMRKA